MVSMKCGGLCNSLGRNEEIKPQRQWVVATVCFSLHLFMYFKVTVHINEHVNMPKLATGYFPPAVAGKSEEKHLKEDQNVAVKFRKLATCAGNLCFLMWV